MSDSSMRAGRARGVLLVAGREIDTRIRSRTFVVSTVVLLLAVVGFVAFTALSGASATSGTVAVDDSRAGAELRAVAAGQGGSVDTRVVDGEAQGRDLVLNGDVDAYVGARSGVQVFVKSTVDSGLKAHFDALAGMREAGARASSSGGDAQAVGEAIIAGRADVVSVQPVSPDQSGRTALALATGVLLYFSLVLFGTSVAQGVVEEKSNRVVELLLTTVRSWQLLFGKVLGIGVVGLTQLAIVLGAGVGGALLFGAVELPSGTSATVLSALGWYVLGFLLFATMLAAAASLVSRQEELQSVISPVLMLMAVPFFVGVMAVVREPGSQVMAWASVVPPFAPILMPIRIAAGVAAAWEVALAVVLTVGAVGALLALAGRIYSNSVLRTGGRMKLVEALSVR